MIYPKQFADFIYDIVEDNLKGFDAIYEAYILNLVGLAGLDALRKHKYVETCGIVNGMQLYVLCRAERGVTH